MHSARSSEAYPITTWRWSIWAARSMLGQPSSGKSASTAKRGVARSESPKGVLVVSSTPFEDSGRATLAAPTRAARISGAMRVKDFSKEVEILTGDDGPGKALPGVVQATLRQFAAAGGAIEQVGQGFTP